MENEINVFTKGINTDLHPLVMPNDTLTSALNGTTITYNGNEFILQNDMGNTLIQDSTTGYVMGLSDGFIPTGMKEFGGILYIASYNPNTKQGELGTIPSPNIEYKFINRDISSLNVALTKNIVGQMQIADEGYASNKDIGLYDDFILLNDFEFKAGDKFILQLDFSNPELISTVKDRPQELGGSPYYLIELYAITSVGIPKKLNPKAQTYYTSEGVQFSSEWFISSSIQLDWEQMRSDWKLFQTYPNIPKGKLAIRIIPNFPQNIQLGLKYYSYVTQKTVVKIEDLINDPISKKPADFPTIFKPDGNVEYAIY